MLSIIPVSLVAMPYAIGSLIFGSKTVRFAGLLALGVIASTSNYRPGEGWLSLKVTAPVTPGKGAGGILWELGERYEGLQRFRGKVYSFTKREAATLTKIVEAVLVCDHAVPILEDFLDQYPPGRLQQEG